MLEVPDCPFTISVESRTSFSNVFTSASLLDLKNTRPTGFVYMNDSNRRLELITRIVPPGLLTFKHIPTLKDLGTKRI